MRSLLLLIAIATFTLGGCTSPQGTTPAAKRADVLAMRADSLERFYDSKPFLQARVERAAGYGVFSNFGMKLFVAGGGGGFGVVHDKRRSRDIFMRVAEANVGLGLGAKNFRALFIFNNERVLNDFITKGWDFGGDAEATAKADNEGGEASASASVKDIDIYTMTKTGAVLAATVGGTRYWRDDELN